MGRLTGRRAGLSGKQRRKFTAKQKPEIVVALARERQVPAVGARRASLTAGQNASGNAVPILTV